MFDYLLCDIWIIYYALFANQFYNSKARMPVRLFRQRFQKRQVLAEPDCAVSLQVSGLLVDRIDIHIDVPTISFRKLRLKSNRLDSEAMARECLIVCNFN